MPAREIITLDEAQVSAERFLEERLKNLKRISVDRIKLSSIEGIIIYEVEGFVTTGGSFFSKNKESSFKIQVAANDAAIVGYETQV